MIEWLAVAVPTILSLAAGVYAHIAHADRRNEQKILDQAKALSEHVEAVEGRLDGLTGRVATLEERAKHVPNAESLRRIYEQIREMAQTLHEMKGVVGEMQALKKVILQEAFSRQSR